MANAQPHNNIKLGVFVLAGLLLFILTLYVIGKNENYFGSNFELKARFANVNGLVNGDNIRFAGIQAGTVKRITLINDTAIEVTLLLDNAMRPFIRTNALASIGSEGLMGNKIINIQPVTGPAALVQPGDHLPVEKIVGTDEMLATLAKTNNNIEDISEDLKGTIRRINSSTALWTILNDGSLARNLRSSLAAINQASQNANALTTDLRVVMADTRAGKGSVGALLRDTALSSNLTQAVEKIRSAGVRTDQLVTSLQETIDSIHQDVTGGQGAVHSLLKDPALVTSLNASMENIRQGTAAFNQDMEALKHNFLLRGYFRKQEKKQQQKSKSLTTLP